MRWWILIGLAACTDLPPIQRDLCGNGVLEPGEQCDTIALDGALCGEAMSPNACRVICSDERSCPSGWRCGRDQRCRRPSGFVSGERIPLSGDELVAGDFDGDTQVDLSSISNGAIEISYGERGPAVTAAQRFNFPAVATGVAAHVADLDEDGRLDVVVPVAEGVLTVRGTRDRRLSTVSHPLDALPGIDDLSLLPVDVLISRTRFSVGVLVTPLALTMDAQQVATPASPSSLAGRPPRAWRAAADIAQDFALPVRGERRITVWTLILDPALSVLRFLERPAATMPRPVDIGAWFADVDGDGLLDLVARVLDAPDQLQVAYGQPDLTFQPGCSVRFPVGMSLTTHIIDIADIDGNGAADYVAPSAIFLSVGPSSRCGEIFVVSATLENTNPLVEALVGDFNGDGKLDVAGVRSSRDAITIYLQNQPGPFNPRTRSLSRGTSMLRSGDFDGDGIQDLAFVAPRAGRDRVQLIYGAREGGIGEASEDQGDFDDVFCFEPLHSINFEAGFDSMTDLFVGARRPDMTTGFTEITTAVLRGDPNRRMFAPLGFGGYGPSAFTPRLVASGEFLSDACAGCRDYFGVGERGGARDYFLAPGRSDHDLSRVSSSSTRRRPVHDDLPSLCAPRFASGDLDGDGRDEMIVADAPCPARSSSFFAIFRFSASDRIEDLALEIVDAGALGATPRPRLDDLDRDGDLDLLLLHGDVVSIATNVDGQLRSLTALPLPEGKRAVDARPIDLGPPGLAVLHVGTGTIAAEQVSLLAREGESWALRTTITDIPGARSLEVLDFDEDGLDDFVLGDGLEARFFSAIDGGQP